MLSNVCVFVSVIIPGIMNKFVHVDRFKFRRFDIKSFLEVYPADGSGTIQCAPAVHDTDVTIFVPQEEFLEIFEDAIGRLSAQPVCHNHMTSDQKSCSPLCLYVAPKSKYKLLVCILPLNLICHGIEFE